MTFIDMYGVATVLKPWVFILVMGAVGIVLLGFYLLRAFGLYALAKRHGERKGVWTAFCPIIWVYIASKLAGSVYLFGKKVKSFATIILIVAVFAEGLLLTINGFRYAPMIGYYFQGGELLISMTTEYLPTNALCVSTSLFYICAPNINIPYSAGLGVFIDVLMYLQYVASIVYLVFTVFMYSSFFKAYLPGHYFVATIFSIFGLFPPFAFAVRKNDKMDYDQYMRAQYTAFYGVPPQTGNPYNNQHSGYYGRADVANSDPFGEFEDKAKEEPFGEFSSDDPFGEFNDKGDN